MKNYFKSLKHKIKIKTLYQSPQSLSFLKEKRQTLLMINKEVKDKQYHRR